MYRIGFLGPEGTFSHETALEYSPNGSQLIAYPTIPDMVTAVERGELCEAILPIENSLEGGVIPTLDILMDADEVKITGELIHEIRENLLVKRGTKKEGIKLILSHMQPLGQCRRYLHNNFPGVELRSVNSTAAAAENVMKSNGTIASIGSAAAAELYGLEILQPDIQDEEGNVTRFIIVGSEYSEKKGKCKTSVIFSVGHTPGSLYKVLGILDLWEINMTRIESRPAKGKLGTYVFYVDIEGHIDNPDVSEAIQMIKRKTTLFKFLGSYTAAIEP